MEFNISQVTTSIDGGLSKMNATLFTYVEQSHTTPFGVLRLRRNQTFLIIVDFCPAHRNTYGTCWCSEIYIIAFSVRKYVVCVNIFTRFKASYGNILFGDKRENSLKL